MERFTSAEYHQQCADIANECVTEAEGDSDRAQELIHEAVDSHQWIIYTYFNGIVLEHSSNRGAYFENYGALGANSYSDAMIKMAFAAMHQDVCECLEDALNAYEAAQEVGEES